VRTGFPFGVTATDVANAGTGLERASLVGDPHLSDPSPKKWFNTAAFAVPAQYTFGTAGRNILTGPSLVNLDFGLMRLFPVGEHRRLQFRGEFFNSLNHPNYGMPVTGCCSTNFGTISSASSRIAQLGLKFIF